MPNIQHQKMKLGLIRPGQYYANGGFVRAMQDGGDVMNLLTDLSPEVQQVARAFQSGEIDNSQALQAFVELGFNDDQLLQASEALDQIESATVENETFVDGGFVAQSRVDDEEDEENRRQRAAISAQKSQGVLGQLGSGVKDSLVNTAVSLATKALFGMQDGGLVPDAEVNPLQQIASALQSGQITPEQAATAMMEIGVPPQQIQQVLSSATVPLSGPLAASPQSQASPEQMMAEEIAMNLDSNSGGPELPSERFEHGGSVGQSKMMSMKTSGPLSSIKTKSVNGYNTEEMTLSFDGKAAMNAPMNASMRA